MAKTRVKANRNEGKKKDIRFYKQTGKYTKRPDPNAL